MEVGKDTSGAHISSWFNGVDRQPYPELNHDMTTDVCMIGAGISGLTTAYRDSNGVLHECSAICPHLHSIVRWNSSEKTWDCPAHGSPFTGEGTAINGSAISSLHKKSSRGNWPEFPASFS